MQASPAVAMQQRLITAIPNGDDKNACSRQQNQQPQDEPAKTQSKNQCG
jgi:hypothetical protein